MPARSQTLIPLTSGAYKGRNAISDFQVCENLFPEKNPENTEPGAPTTHYQREGERPISAPPISAAGRGVFTLSNGAMYAIVGNSVYAVKAPNFLYVLLGNIITVSGPVYMKDNGITAMIVDGSTTAFTITMATNAFGPLVDPTGTYVGASRIDFADTYFAMNAVGTNGWMVTDPDSVTFNALQQANADSSPDPIVTLAFNIRQMWILKVTHTEIWYLAGSTPFPYQEWPNVYVPYGCDAVASLVQADVNLYWISRNDQGHAIALKTKGDSVEAISTRALEYEWSGYTKTSDAIGRSFQVSGHTFVAFDFPAADKTWVYDLATEQWHARIWIDSSGTAHRDRVSFCCAVGTPGGYPETVVGQDWQTGQIYALDPRYYTDNGTPIVCRRSFPHQLADLREITHTSFVADFATGDAIGYGETGTNAIQGLGLPTPALCMRFSKNGGNTWSNYRQKKLITSGNYRSMMRYRGLGMGRDWVFELMWVYPGPSALNGAYADVIEHSA